MKKTIALAVLLTALASPAVFAADPPAAPVAQQAYNYKTPLLDRAHFDALLAKPGKLLIIDVRRPDELTKLGGFPVYLSLQPGQLEQELAYIPKDRQIVTVSNHAHRAGDVGDKLSAQGFKVAGAVGVLDYEKEGGTLTKITPPANTASNP